MMREGRAAINPDYIPKSITSEEDFKTIFKRETRLIIIILYHAILSQYH